MRIVTWEYSPLARSCPPNHKHDQEWLLSRDVMFMVAMMSDFPFAIDIGDRVMRLARSILAQAIRSTCTVAVKTVKLHPPGPHSR